MRLRKLIDKFVISRRRPVRYRQALNEGYQLVASWESGRTWMRIDIHNHAVPETVLDFSENEPAFGDTITGERHMSGGPEGEYELRPEFFDADAKVANLELAGLDAAVVSVDPPFFG